MEEHLVEAADGTSLWAGASAPPADERDAVPVLFLHGFSGSSSAATHLRAAVNGAGRRFIAPDMRGHGRSAKPASDEAYSLEALTDDVRAVLDASGARRVHLVGHCMGGMVAASFATRHQERLASLSLVGTSLNPSGDRPLAERVSAMAQDPLRPIARRLFPARAESGRHLDYSAFRSMGDLYWRRLVADYGDLTWDVADRIIRTARSVDLEPDARGLTVPALVVHGALDTVFPPAAARRTHDAIRGSRLAILPGDNHVTLVLDPGSDLFACLLAFFDETETTELRPASDQGRDAVRTG